ncbi:glycosyltransferase family 4 protein [Acinetobacter baumannii]|uniref:glycosyltransferase family 4 protein n=1 Tax=Acinetobacter baumannii TaxID=470 RepID=UPI001C5C00AD|nr:glycosyltransferase family 4 protein [Acinetobacter baumannii]MCG5760539.1 glycosyltransferase family 4 protein [Acinetobacter baumannii]MCG5808567.1 glycosyltransferase family 4 protein [Acinetobacter baumannii]MCG5823405.1 glycosyltransferase family 4 protein [Acinetobacter baumannii]MCG5830907.1 glycosyltransferase family 4 protein [Acinetobacter baumannii]MCG5838355.1 glycosyltransferase family 4 protein [Acinetobacter baumannii]
MKNILFLIENLSNTGGTERVTTLVANELVKNGFNVSILSLVEGMTPFFKLNNKIDYLSLYSKKISFKKNFIEVVLKIRKYIKQKNITTLIVVDSISCIFTIPALFGLNVKHICWEHFNFINNNGTILRNYGRFFAAKFCDDIVTLTSRDIELWKKGIKNIKAKIIAIPNPSPYSVSFYQSQKKEKIVLAVGRLTKVKGFDLLLEAWSLVCKVNKTWCLYIVGGGEEENSLKELAKVLNITNRVNFIGPSAEVDRYYKRSSFYCLSSRNEGFPMVLLEAQSFGLPIVSFDCDTGPNEIIEHNKNGLLVEHMNVEVLAENMLTMIDLEPARYESMVQSSIILSERFTVDKIILKWIDIINN